MSDRVGYWADMENPYITYDNNYIESEWWALKTIYAKGLLYKGHKIVALLAPAAARRFHRMRLLRVIKTVKDTSIFVTFPIIGQNASLLAWTTTPWTLPRQRGAVRKQELWTT